MRHSSAFRTKSEILLRKTALLRIIPYFFLKKYGTILALQAKTALSNERKRFLPEAVPHSEKGNPAYEISL